MLVQSLQSSLQSRYDLTIPYDVSEFVSHDAELAREFLLSEGNTAESGSTLSAETLFVRQADETLEFTLYLDPDVLESAKGETRLDDVCSVVEGVSHAVCLLWHAHHDRQIRPVDLELQAEIDKYLVLLGSETNESSCQSLYQQLFSRVQYNCSNDDTLLNRYQTANDNAASYCQWLYQAFIASGNQDGLFNELARFYRLSGHAKFQRIRKLH